MDNIVEIKINRVVTCLKILMWGQIIIGIFFSVFLYSMDVQWEALLFLMSFIALHLVLNYIAQNKIKTRSRVGYSLSLLLFSILNSPLLFPVGIYGLYNLMNKELKSEVYKI